MHTGQYAHFLELKRERRRALAKGKTVRARRLQKQIRSMASEASAPARDSGIYYMEAE